MVNTVKFSEFPQAARTDSSTEFVGLATGLNIRLERQLNWTTLTRPNPPYNGLMGFNTDLQKYEFWDAVAGVWNQFEDSGDIANLIARLAAHTVGDGASMIGLLDQGGVLNKTVQDFNDAPFIAQTDDGTLPNAQFLASLSTGALISTTGTGILSISAPLTSIHNLVTVPNNLIYTTASNVYAALAPVVDAILITDPAGVPTWSNTTIPAHTLAGNIDADTFRVRDASDPLLPQDYATKNYVDNIVQNIHAPTFAATTANLAGYVYNNGVSGVGATLTAGGFGAFTTDGQSPSLNDRILVPFQTNAFENGVYILTTIGDGATNAVLTRSSDYDQTEDIQAGDKFIVLNGTLYGGSEWLQTAIAPIVIGTDDINFQTLSAGFLAIANNLSELTATALTARTNILAAVSGANTDITSMIGLTGVLQGPTGINDANGNEMLVFMSQAAAVNYWEIQNRATGGNVGLFATGSDAGVSAQFYTKNGFFEFRDATNTIPAQLRLFNTAGTFAVGLLSPAALGTDLNLTLPSADGSSDFMMKTDGAGNLSFANGSQVAGTTTNDNATAGNIGEFISAQLAFASRTALTTNVSKDVTSILLTPGDWDVTGSIFVDNDSTALFETYFWVNTVSATIPDLSLVTGRTGDTTTGKILNFAGAVQPLRVSINANTTVYLSVRALFTAGNTNASGKIMARRVR